MRIPERLKKATLALGGFLVCEAATRLMLPSINGAALGESIRANIQLRIFDLITGGSLSRGAVFGIGLLTYISARIWVRIARLAFRDLDAIATGPGGERRVRRWVRWTTAGLSVAQSAGLVRFLLNAPGAVKSPGPLFVVETMGAFMAVSLGVMWFSEALTPSSEPDDDVVQETSPEQSPAMTAPGEIPAADAQPLLGAGSASDQLASLGKTKERVPVR